ncbi:hypothetical protein NXX16_18480 [Bacteroides fragilis]|nr:hypothetical protein NXX16_18480 [Bacteroides fragilis]
MVRNVSLKREIEDILENARLSKNLCVSERINEQGFKCTYSFPGNMREELMRRASRPKRQQPQYKGGEYTQKGLALLEKNREAIQVLFDIRYLMEKHGYDVQNACKVLFKDKRRCLLVFAVNRYVSIIWALCGTQNTVSRLPENNGIWSALSTCCQCYQKHG